MTATARHVLAVTALLVPLALFACAKEEQPRVAAAALASGGQPLQRVKVGQLPYLSSAPMEIARQRGFFRDEGIDLQVVTLSTPEAVSSVAAGQIDVYASFLTVGVVNAIARGASIAMVADRGYSGGCGAEGIVVREGTKRKLETPEGLRGTAFGLRTMTTGEYIVDRLLQKRGVRREDVRMVDLGAESMVDAFRTGAVDFSVQTEPNVTRFKELGAAHLWMRTGDIVEEAQWGVIAFGPRLLAADRDLGIRFLRAYVRGIRAYSEGKTDANVRIIAAMTGETEETIRSVCWPAFRLDGRLRPAGVADFFSWTRERGYVETDVPIERLVDSSLIEEALRR